jgi:CheY-like chemotaxis protein
MVKLLVVDNEPEDRVLVQRILQAHGYMDVVYAINGENAIAEVQNGGIDLILMDMLMPTMDGYTATQNLRQSGFTKPIIAVTGAVMRNELNRARSVGVNDIIQKPYDVDSFIRVVEHYCPKK